MDRNRIQCLLKHRSMCPSIFNRFSVIQLVSPSLSSGEVPLQWKKACITPMSKVAHPAQASDYRPISITPVLSRMLVRHIVRSYVYPAIQQPPSGLHFADQFAFRPTGSTDAALITLIHTIFSMLTTQLFARVFVLDCSKAFDTVTHTDGEDGTISPTRYIQQLDQ